MEKLIIAACICGAEVTKEHNPAVPYTVEEIVREAKSAYDAGASVIHLHMRESRSAWTLSMPFVLTLSSNRQQAEPSV